MNLKQKVIEILIFNEKQTPSRVALSLAVFLCFSHFFMTQEDIPIWITPAWVPAGGGCACPALHLNLSSSNLYSTDQKEDAQVEVSGTGNGDTVSVSQIKGKLSLNNCDGASVPVNGKPVSGLTDQGKTSAPVPTASVVPTPVLNQDKSSNGLPSETMAPDTEKGSIKKTVGKAKIKKVKKLKGRKIKLVLKRIKHAEGYEIMYNLGNLVNLVKSVDEIDEIDYNMTRKALRRHAA